MKYQTLCLLIPVSLVYSTLVVFSGGGSFQDIILFGMKQITLHTKHGHCV